MPEQINVRLTADTTPALKSINSAIAQIEKRSINLNIKSSAPLGKITAQVGEFDKSLEAANARVGAFGASAAVILGVNKAMSELVSSTVEVNKALIDINSILNTSTRGLNKFGDELFSIAKSTGQSFDSVAKAATEFARQGLSIEDTLKRTKDALILSRLSGLDYEKSVESLTATVNSFGKEVLSTTEIVNKLATVDQKFAVSTKDLAEGLSRVGATAQDAGVGFDELISLITSLQQTTARGGAVIGNGLKSIFTRIERTDTLDQLQNLGVATKELVNGVEKTRPAIEILKELAGKYGELGEAQKSQIGETVAGVFQINTFKALIADLSKQTSVYSQAVAVAGGATTDAYTRNEKLNESLDALANKTLVNVKEAFSKVGDLTIAPTIKGGLGGINSILEGISKSLDPESKDLGDKLGQGFLKGIGSVLSGPALVLLGGVFLKLSANFALFAADAGKSLLGLNKASEERATLEKNISSILASEPDLLSKITNGTISVAEAEKSVLIILNEQLELRSRIAKIASTSATAAGLAGFSVNRSVGSTEATLTKTKKASGYIPSYAAMDEIQGAKKAGYNAGNVEYGKGTIGGKSFIKNSAEIEIPNFGTNGDSAVLPPGNVGKNLISASSIPNYVKRDLIEHLNSYATGKIPLSSRVPVDFNGQKAFLSKKVLNKPYYDYVNETGNVTQVGDKTIVRTLYGENKRLLGRLINYQKDLDPTSEGIGYTKSKSKGAANFLFNQTLQDTPAAKSRVLIGQLDKYDPLAQFQSPFEQFLKVYPQIKYRIKPSTVTTGELLTQENHLAKFNNLSELREYVNSHPSILPDILKKEEGGYQPIRSLVTRKLPTKALLDGAVKFRAGGFIPNYSGVQDAVSRESFALQQRGINPDGKVYLDSDPRVGMLVANKIDEPNGGSEGVSRAIREGANPKTYGMSGGNIPNFADQDVKSDFYAALSNFKKFGDVSKQLSEEQEKYLRSLASNSKTTNEALKTWSNNLTKYGAEDVPFVRASSGNERLSGASFQTVNRVLPPSSIKNPRNFVDLEDDLLAPHESGRIDSIVKDRATQKAKNDRQQARDKAEVEQRIAIDQERKQQRTSSKFQNLALFSAFGLPVAADTIASAVGKDSATARGVQAASSSIGTALSLSALAPPTGKSIGLTGPKAGNIGFGGALGVIGAGVALGSSVNDFINARYDKTGEKNDAFQSQLEKSQKLESSTNSFKSARDAVSLSADSDPLAKARAQKNYALSLSQFSDTNLLDNILKAPDESGQNSIINKALEAQNNKTNTAGFNAELQKNVKFTGLDFANGKRTYGVENLPKLTEDFASLALSQNDSSEGLVKAFNDYRKQIEEATNVTHLSNDDFTGIYSQLQKALKQQATAKKIAAETAEKENKNLVIREDLSSKFTQKQSDFRKSQISSSGQFKRSGIDIESAASESLSNTLDPFKKINIEAGKNADLVKLQEQEFRSSETSKLSLGLQTEVKTLIENNTELQGDLKGLLDTDFSNIESINSAIKDLVALTSKTTKSKEIKALTNKFKEATSSSQEIDLQAKENTTTSLASIEAAKKEQTRNALTSKRQSLLGSVISGGYDGAASGVSKDEYLSTFSKNLANLQQDRVKPLYDTARDNQKSLVEQLSIASNINPEGSKEIDDLRSRLEGEQKKIFVLEKYLSSGNAIKQRGKLTASNLNNENSDFEKITLPQAQADSKNKDIIAALSKKELGASQSSLVEIQKRTNILKKLAENSLYQKTIDDNILAQEDLTLTELKTRVQSVKNTALQEVSISNALETRRQLTEEQITLTQKEILVNKKILASSEDIAQARTAALGELKKQYGNSQIGYASQKDFLTSDEGRSSRLSTAELGTKSGDLKGISGLTEGFKSQFSTLEQNYNDLPKLGADAANDLKSGVVGALKGMAIEGTSAADSFKKAGLAALQGLSEKFLEKATNTGLDSLANAGFSLLGSAAGSFQARNRGGMIHASTGMYIPKSAGSGTRDDVPAVLTAGEYVIKRGSVEKYGKSTLDAINAGQISHREMGGFMRRFATGGLNTNLTDDEIKAISAQREQIFKELQGAQTASDAQGLGDKLNSLSFAQSRSDSDGGRAVFGIAGTDSKNLDISAYEDNNVRKVYDAYYGQASSREEFRIREKARVEKLRSDYKKAQRNKEYGMLIQAAVSVAGSAAGAAASSGASSAASSYGSGSISAGTNTGTVRTGGNFNSRYGGHNNGGILRANNGVLVSPAAGSGTRDDIPAMLTAGEYVLNRNAVQKYGVNAIDRINSGDFGKYAMGGFLGSRKYADGGYIYDGENKEKGNDSKQSSSSGSTNNITITVNVASDGSSQTSDSSSGSGGKEGEKKKNDTVGKEMATQIEAIVLNTIVKQQRQGGILSGEQDRR